MTSILTIIANCLILDKANDSWWKAIIPFYGRYSLFKIVGKKKLFWVDLINSLLALGVIIALCITMIAALVNNYQVDTKMTVGSINMNAFITALTTSASFMISFYALSILSLISTVIGIIYYVSLAHSFGCGVGFVIGLILLNVVFLCIIAFSKGIQYVGDFKKEPEAAPIS